MTQGHVPPAANHLDWAHFAARSGEEGHRWCATYQQHRWLEALSSEALDDCRHGREREGLATLRRMRSSLRALRAVDPAVRDVLARWYHGVSGYQQYCVGQFQQADRSMTLAHHAVTRAIGRRPFLMLLANHCQEFRLHRARIARNAGRWRVMDGHVLAARAMSEGRLPYCVLPDSREIDVAAIRRFADALPCVTPEELAVLAELLEDDTRRRGFARFVRGMHRLPGIVLLYP